MHSLKWRIHKSEKRNFLPGQILVVGKVCVTLPLVTEKAFARPSVGFKVSHKKKHSGPCRFAVKEVSIRKL